MSKSMSMKEQALLKRYSELKYDTDRYGPGSLMTQASHVNANRLIMTNHHLTDMVAIKDSEPPSVLAGFENPLSEFSFMLDKTGADEGYEVVAKFVKDAYTYVIIGYDKERKHYHAWKRIEMEEHSEGCATKYNNTYLDSLEIGDYIPPETYVSKSDNYDIEMNYTYGKNLNTVYLVSSYVLEDGVLLMNGADKMLSTYHITHREISLADDEILLNLYGKDGAYQPLPAIGEKTHKGVLAVSRRIDNAKAAYALKTSRLRKPERGDTRIYAEGRVIDITILYNKEKDKFIKSGATKQISDLYDSQQEYFMNLYKFMMNIVDNSLGEYTYSDEFTIICEEAHNFVDSSAFFADNDNIYGNMQIIVTILEEVKAIVGTKVVGRFGNKGTVSRIFPPEKSWFMEDGTPIHAVVSCLGVVGRLNQAQLNEHNINDITATAVRKMKELKDPDEKLAIVVDVLSYLNSHEAKAYKKYIQKLSTKEKIVECRQIERNGISVIQEPVKNANMFDIHKAHEKYKPNYQRIIYPDGTPSMKKVICAKMFFMRLVQDPFKKYSIRSRGTINPLTNLPGKSNQSRDGLAYASDVPVRIGEYEIEVLLTMVNNPAAVAMYMSENSTSWKAKVTLAEHLAGLSYEDGQVDGDNIDNDFNVFEGKKNMQLISAYNNVLGTDIIIETEKNTDDTDDE